MAVALVVVAAGAAATGWAVAGAAAAAPAMGAAVEARVAVPERSDRRVNLTALFIRRPVMTTLVMLGILVFGVIGYVQLPVSDLPTVDYPTLNVSASLPGASPETMAATVATPLEKAFSGIAGIDEITSNSTSAPRTSRCSSRSTGTSRARRKT